MISSFQPNLPTLVCLHSSASSPRQWQALAEAARGQWNLCIPHLLGYGEPLQGDAGNRMGEHVAYLHNRLEEIPGPLHMVGHSMGGAVALRYTLQHPGRLASLTVYESVCFDVLFSGEPANAPADEINRLGNLVAYRVRQDALDQAAQMFVDYWNGRGAWAGLSAEARRRLASRMPQVAREFEALFESLPAPAAYARLRLPVQILHGNRSPMPAREVAVRLAGLVPGALRRELAGLGHMGPLTHPAEVNPLILRFAADHARPGRMRAAA